MESNGQHLVTLRITISGMCMFVPDDGPGGQVVHVLMPKMGHGATPAHDGHTDTHAGHPAHFVRLAYHTADAVDQTGGGGSTAPIGLVDLGGYRILVGAGLGTPNTAIDEHEVVRLDECVCFTGVDRACLETAGEDRLTSRAELRAGKFVYNYPPEFEHCIDLPGSCPEAQRSKVRCQRMAEHVDWELELPGTTAELQSLVRLEPLAGTSSRPPVLPTLRPTDGIVHVGLVHVTPDAFPTNSIPSTALGGGIRHFAAYYDLGKQPVPCRPIPTRKATKGPAKKDPSATCMTAFASLA